MHIAIDARAMNDHFPGIARYTFNLACALLGIAPQDEFTILWYGGTANTRFDVDQLSTRPNARLFRVPSSCFSLSQQWKVPAALNRRQVDIYHSPYYLMPYLTRRPTLVTVHDLIPLLYPHYFTPAQRLIFKTAIRLALRSALKVVVPSQSTAGDLRRLIPTSGHKTVVVPEASDPVIRRVSPEVIAAVRARHALPERYLLYLGSNKPHKNLVRLVEAFGGLGPFTSQYALVIAGHWDGRHQDARRRAEELGLSGSIRWLGSVPAADLPGLYSGATLFVFPSEYEGFGLPVLEAMACGSPVMCSSGSAIPELTADAALLVDPHDVIAWTEAIRRVLLNETLRRELGARGLRRSESFSWGRAAQSTYALYQEVC